MIQGEITRGPIEREQRSDDQAGLTRARRLRGRSGRLTTSVARIRTVAGRGCSLMMPSSIGVGACPHSGNAGRDWSDPVTGLGRPIIGHPGPSWTPTDCLTATYASQEANGAQPVRLSTRSLAPGFAWHQRRPGFPADYCFPCNAVAVRPLPCRPRR
jgi:hypothetical protein